MYICDFCPKKIDKPEDGIIIFGSVCIVGERGLKARFGEVPVEANLNKINKLNTHICFNCLSKKLPYQQR